MSFVLLNKPYRVLSQFRDDKGRRTLAEFISERDVYAVGRLDFDSEGLLVLTDDGRLQARISRPKSKIIKKYWAQVEGSATQAQLEKLQDGVSLKDGKASARSAELIDAPAGLWPRDPPIRHRLNVPDCWIEIGLSEGRNRQVRRMTAAVGLPTLRLIRQSVGPWALGDLKPGETRVIDNDTAWEELRSCS